MKTLLGITLIALMTTVSAAEKLPDLHDHLGIQLWSLRAQFKTDGAAALDVAKQYDLKEIEAWGGTGLAPAQLLEATKARGLTIVSSHVGYDALKKDLAGVVRDTKALGAKYAFVAHLPKFRGLNADGVKALAAEFNAFGEAFKAEGIHFGLHNHGFEFTPTGNGDEIGFDVFARETKPELVCFELDVFWAVHAGQDPVKLLQKYPKRWVALHVKDMRKGAPTNLSDGTAPATDAVAVGQGQIDWPAILKTAKSIGVKYYFLEDETTAPLECIPASVKYLRGLKP
jgi:sugar phosphate isomerase/epimerase